jgi:hypothetical protein
MMSILTSLVSDLLSLAQLNDRELVCDLRATLRKRANNE